MLNHVKGLGEATVMAVCTNYSKMRSVSKLLSQAVLFVLKK